MRTATRVSAMIAAGLLAACTAGGCGAPPTASPEPGLPGDTFMRDVNTTPTPFGVDTTTDLDSGGFINGGGF